MKFIAVAARGKSSIAFDVFFGSHGAVKDDRINECIRKEVGQTIEVRK